MKIKKNSTNIVEALKSMADNDIRAVPTFMSIDSEGNIIIESFKKLLDYTGDKISISARDKKIYIYGESMKIKSFSRTGMQIDGKIHKIEFFEVE